MISIQLNPDEILQGALVGVKRNVNTIARGQDNTNRYDGGSWNCHIEGALAEMAVAKASGKFWSTGEILAGDVGEFEVRVTSHTNGRLLLRPDDKDKSDKFFILVRGMLGKYQIAGWIIGVDGMQDEYWCEPTNGKRDPAWFIPANKLHSFGVEASL